MVFNEAKTMKKGRYYYTKIGKYLEKVVIVKIVHYKRNSGGAYKGRVRINRLAQLRKVGSKKVLPKLRRVSDLLIRRYN